MMDDNDIMREFADDLQDEFESSKHSVKYKQNERKLRKKQKQVNRLKAVLRFLIFFLILFLGYEFVMLPQWYLPQDAFKKQNGEYVEILNNKLIPTSVISDAISDVRIPKLPIFLFKVKPIKHEIYKIPVVKSVYVRRYGFPPRIQIIIKERVPYAVLKTNLHSQPFAFFTQDGVLIINRKYMTYAESDKTLRIITKSTHLDKDWSMKKAQYLGKIIKDVETYSNEKVSYIDMRNPNDVYIRIPSANIRLGALDSTVFERIKRIYTILPQIKEYNSRIKYIDLSWDKVNYLKLNKEDKNK
ncbi:FtsQ-type POTRA domain-containing protein [bacterium]|nr:FtsQ-type POTRA domain-containing protein [bacterium]